MFKPHPTLSYSVVAIAIALFGSVQLRAQPAYYLTYEKMYNESVEGSPEQIDAAMKMIDVIFHTDVGKALEIAQSTTEIARKAKNKSALAACLMDQATWTAYMSDSRKAEHLLKQAEAVFEEDGDPRFVAQYYSSRFGYSLINEDEEYNPNHYLEKIRESALAADDPHLLMGYYYMAATAKVFVGKVPPTDDSIQELKKELKQLAESNNYETGRLNLMMLEAKEAQVKGNPVKALMILGKACEHARKTGFPLFEVRALLTIAYVEKTHSLNSFVKVNGPLEHYTEEQKVELATRLAPVRERVSKCLELARDVGMSSYIFESLIYSAQLAFHCGDTEAAKSYVVEADEMDYGCFRSWMFRDELYRYAIDIYGTDNDIVNVKKYAHRLASPEHVNKVGDASNKALRFAQQLRDTKVEQKTDKARQEVITRQLASNLDNAEQEASRFKGIATILMMAVGLLGLGFALFWNRSRLRAVESKLSDEMQASRVNKEMREVLQERVNRLQRMESLGMLAGGVAHDFNNLLVGVMCNAEVLETQSPEMDDFSKQRVQQIMHSAEKAADLSRQMLAYAGKTQIQKQVVDLNEVAANMKRVLNATVGPGAVLALELCDGPIVAEVDETQIEQVLLNLVSNAKQASGTDATITVKTGRETITELSSDKRLYGTREIGGDFVYFEVADTGKGIEEADLERIFEPFFTVCETGRGLGLAVVYGIVNGHDGLVRVCSEVGAGTYFRVLIPEVAVRHKVKAPQFNKRPVVKADKNFRPGTILVVDDEPTVNELATTLLKLDNWEVVNASSGEEALELLKPGHPFSCVLLDFMMEGMNAEGVISELKRRGGDVSLPIILMSGYSSTQLDKFRQSKEVVSILSKPFRAAELSAAVRIATNQVDHTVGLKS